MKDFFISYSTLDEAWAEWIAWELEAAGHSTMMQKWDFTPGKNFAVEMQNAIGFADRIILVLSESFLRSDFTKPEWAAFFAVDPTGEKQKIVPIRVERCEPVGLLRQLVYIDLVDASAATCRERLQAGVLPGRKKPTIAPAFPRPAEIAEMAPAFPISDPREKRTRRDVSSRLWNQNQSYPKNSGLRLISSRVLGRAFIREALSGYLQEPLTTGAWDREGRPVRDFPWKWMTLIVVDVDGMSGINRRYGIVVGDAVVETIGRMTLQVASHNLSGRLGDDTFFVIVQSDLDGAMVAATKLLDEIRCTHWNATADGLYVRCSAGIAQFSRAEHPNATVTRAVQGLRVARGSGGNCVLQGPRFVAKGSYLDWELLVS